MTSIVITSPKKLHQTNVKRVFQFGPPYQKFNYNNGNKFSCSKDYDEAEKRNQNSTIDKLEGGSSNPYNAHGNQLSRSYTTFRPTDPRQVQHPSYKPQVLPGNNNAYYQRKYPLFQFLAILKGY